MSKFKLQYNVAQLPFCCGVKEVGEMHLVEHSDKQVQQNEKRNPRAYQGWSDTPEAAAALALGNIRTGYDQFSIQFWFVNEANYAGEHNGEYRCDVLRELVRKQNDVTELAEYVNRNSRNKINGYMLSNNISLEEMSEDDDY